LGICSPWNFLPDSIAAAVAVAAKRLAFSADHTLAVFVTVDGAVRGGRWNVTGLQEGYVSEREDGEARRDRLS
jgi:hypothetical protein